MSPQSRLVAGVLLILMPLVVYGGSILSLLIGNPSYAQNELRQAPNSWRAGHAHAGVLLLLLLVLSLVTLRYVAEAALSEGMKTLVRHSIPAAAVLLPAAYLPLGALSRSDGAERPDLPGLLRRGLACRRAPGPRGRPRPGSQGVQRVGI